MPRHHKDWLKAYMQYTQYSESPEPFHFWTGVGTIAGAVRRRVWIEQHHFQWTPNFYIVMVAPPGVAAKTTTLGIGMKMLKEVPGVNFGPDVLTWQSLVTTMAKARALVPIPSTMLNPQEGEIEYMPMSPVTFASGEFGNLLDPSDRQMVDVMVSLWDSQLGLWEKSTKTQGEDKIENPCINMLACTTPAWIRESFPPYFIHGGFASRCIFVYGEKKRKLVAYPGLHADTKLDTLRQTLIEDLVHIGELYGAYHLDAEAVQWGTEWYKAHWQEAQKNTNTRFEGFIARKQTHIHKTALVLAASQRDEPIITKEDLIKADALVSTIEPSMDRVFQEIGMTAETRGTADVISAIRGAGTLTRASLWRGLMHTLSMRQFEEALHGAIQSGFVTQRQVGTDLVLMFNKEQAGADQIRSTG